MRKKFNVIICLLLITIAPLNLTSCDEILDTAYNCSLKDVKLQDKDLRIGKVGQNYFDSIGASVKNDPNDEIYFYDFQFLGQLPKGLYFSTYQNKFEIQGIPEEAKNISFELRVTVQLGEYGYCVETSKNKYSLTILE